MKTTKRFFIGFGIILVCCLMSNVMLDNGVKHSIAQEEALDAEFSADTTTGEVPLTVNFSDESTGNIIEWSWDFGDGGTSGDENPTHQYTEVGTYTVTLTVMDETAETDDEIKEDYIEVIAATQGLDANFSASPTSGQPPLTVNFTDLSTGGAVRWEWDFDNNGVVDSTIQNPSYTYNEAGSFSVKLTVFDGENTSNIEVKTDYINVTEAVTSENLIQITSFESNLTDFPAVPNVPITFTTQAMSAGSETLYYKYRIIPDYCTPSYGATAETRDYSTDRTFTWTPTEQGSYVGEVWVTDTIGDICPAVARISFGVFTFGTLELEVKDAATGDPIGGATAEIGGLSAMTDQDGKTTIADIASGTYTLAVSHPDYLTDEQAVNIIGDETVSLTVALTTGLATGQTRIILTWGASPSDLDSHLTGPDGEGGTFHVYYANRNPAGAEANLDVDDVTSFGPETITILELHSGTYEYHVLDYSNCGCSNPSSDPNPQSTAMGQSGARVVVYSGTSLLGTFQVPTGYGVNWHVFNINGDTGEIIPVNTLGGGTGPVSGGTSALTFCDNNAGYCVSSFQGPDDDTKGLAWDGTHMWVCEGNHAFSVIFKMDIATGESLDYFFSPGPNPQGLAFDGAYLWNLDQTDHKIYKIDPSTKTVLDSIPTPTDNPEDFYTGLAWDGEDFWVAGYTMERNEETYLYEFSNSAVYRMALIELTDTATTSLTQTATVTLTVPLGQDYEMPLGLAHDGDDLWISTYTSDEIWMMDLETQQIAETGKPSPDGGSYGMTWDGLYLWVGSWYGRSILQLDTGFVPTFTEEGALRVNVTDISIDASTLPLAVGTPITITANAVGQASNLYYKIIVVPGYCTTGFGETSQLIQDYSLSKSVEYTASAAGKIKVEVLVTDDPGDVMGSAGNILVSTEELIEGEMKQILYEYTPQGALVQSFEIPYPTGDHPATEYARDNVMNSSGRIFVYNGTFDPYVSILDPTTGTWNHSTFTGWSTVNNVSYGGIAATDQYVFVTDMETAGDGSADEAMGIVRFDLSSSDAVRFAEDIGPIDLTLGLNGMLYALYPGGSPEGRFVDVYDPQTLAFVKTIDLTTTFGHTGHRAIAVNADEELFIADWDGDLQKINAQGTVLATTNLVSDFTLSGANLFDVDVAIDGTVVVSERFGEVFVTDENFSSISSFSVGSNGAFVSIGSLGNSSADTTCQGLGELSVVIGNP